MTKIDRLRSEHAKEDTLAGDTRVKSTNDNPRTISLETFGKFFVIDWQEFDRNFFAHVMRKLEPVGGKHARGGRCFPIAPITQESANALFELAQEMQFMIRHKAFEKMEELIGVRLPMKYKLPDPGIR